LAEQRVDAEGGARAVEAIFDFRKRGSLADGIIKPPALFFCFGDTSSTGF